LKKIAGTGTAGSSKPRQGVRTSGIPESKKILNKRPEMLAQRTNQEPSQLPSGPQEGKTVNQHQIQDLRMLTNVNQFFSMDTSFLYVVKM